MNIKKPITTILTNLLYIDFFIKSEGFATITSLSEETFSDAKLTTDHPEKKPENNFFIPVVTTTDKEQKTVTNFFYKINNTVFRIPQEILNSIIQRTDQAVITYLVTKFFNIDMNDFRKVQENLSLSSLQRPVTTVDSQKPLPPILDEKQSNNPVASQGVHLKSLFTGYPIKIVLSIIVCAGGAIWIFFKPKSEENTDHHNQDKRVSIASEPTTAASQIASDTHELADISPRQLIQAVAVDANDQTPSSSEEVLVTPRISGRFSDLQIPGCLQTR